MTISKQYLQSVRLRRDDVSDFGQYPFALNAIRYLDELTFRPHYKRLKQSQVRRSYLKEKAM